MKGWMRVTVYACDICWPPDFAADDSGILPTIKPHTTQTRWENGYLTAYCSNCGNECWVGVEELVKEE